jgi:hypothetical protein
MAIERYFKPGNMTNTDIRTAVSEKRCWAILRECPERAVSKNCPTTLNRSPFGTDLALCLWAFHVLLLVPN